MDMKKNEKGSSLIFAVVVIMVLSIVIAAALAISYTYYNRSIANNSKRQAYLTAKSVLNNVVDNIVSEKNTNGTYSSLIPSDAGDISYSISDFPAEMGTVKSIEFAKSLEKDEKDLEIEKVTISVSAIYGDKEKTINADLKRYADKYSNWQLIKYYEGEVSTKLNKNVENAEKMLSYANELTDLFNKTGKNDLWRKELKYDDFENGTLSKEYEKCEEYEKGFFDNKLMYNDALLRKFIFYAYYEKNFDEFIVSEVKSDISKEAKDFINKNKYIVIPKYPHSDNSPVIIYADIDFALEGGSWKTRTQLIYNPQEKAWYYLYKAIMPTYFDGSGGAAQKKWDDFVKDVLHNSDKAERIT